MGQAEGTSHEMQNLAGRAQPFGAVRAGEACPQILRVNTGVVEPANGPRQGTIEGRWWSPPFPSGKMLENPRMRPLPLRWVIQRQPHPCINRIITTGDTHVVPSLLGAMLGRFIMLSSDRPQDLLLLGIHDAPSGDVGANSVGSGLLKSS
jgi:hypothetical protein